MKISYYVRQSARLGNAVLPTQRTGQKRGYRIAVRKSCVVCPQRNALRGYSNARIAAAINALRGNSNGIYVNSNALRDVSNAMCGNRNALRGNSNVRCGSSNAVRGISNAVRGNNNAIRGNLVTYYAVN